MSKIGRRARVRSFIVIVSILATLLILSACGQGGNNKGAYYPEDNGVQYTGEGTLETVVQVAFQNTEGMLSYQYVKIIDDQPTVWKALKAVSDNKEFGLVIEKDSEGHIIKVGDQSNDDQNQWFLIVENNVETGNVEELEIGNDESISLSYEPKE